MRQPPGTPTKATRKMDPAMPTTAIPELNAIELTPFAYQTVLEAIQAADKLQIKRLNPTGGANRHFAISSGQLEVDFSSDQVSDRDEVAQ